ncbi:MAG: 23S rRNA (adenine(2503)-C(2))-methyltransferase RlmN [Verrucomicrobia subdivision 3 bacterium]|nr:23S rRNA (adenine(2503)-C(2))-methyltransferase RlmN [Limisphaerales bacterium]
MRLPISSQTPETLRTWLDERGEKPYRASQILKWVHQHFAVDWAAMTNLGESLQISLAESFNFSTVELARKQGDADTTQKFLWKLRDGQLVESVLIPASPALYGEPSDRHTLCISTQVGCAYGCTFCASGLDGFKRNLEPAEIIDQVLAVERAQGRAGQRAINNLVIMGMGEPMANYDNLMLALESLNADWGANIGARKITISTSGLVPQIQKLAAQPRQYRLAISLHGATDEVRDRIMPINRKYPLAKLAAAAEEYQQAKSGKLTLEYILIAGVNDALDQVAPLAELAHRLRAKVNLIPYNHVDGLEWGRPDRAIQDAFHEALVSRGTLTTLRREKGHDIDAACGQLRLRTEKELAAT